MPVEDTVGTVRGSTICWPCRDTDFWQCPRCDGYNRDGASCGNGCCDADCDCPDCDCPDCSADDLDARLHDYSYKPIPVFHGTGPVFLGAEIEVEAPTNASDCTAVATSYLGSLAYLKADSSLNHGFEVVTHPMSYEWAIENFPWEVLTRLADAGCETTTKTGLHVHVSRDGFSSSCHAYRWMKLIYRNQEQVTELAGRHSPIWAAFTDADRRAIKNYVKGARSHRYRAINTSNDETFEVRIFASSLHPHQVQAALAFVAASVEYTRHLTIDEISHGAWAWSAFAAWLTDQPAYAPLTQQMEALACAC